MPVVFACAFELGLEFDDLPGKQVDRIHHAFVITMDGVLDDALGVEVRADAPVGRALLDDANRVFVQVTDDAVFILAHESALNGPKAHKMRFSMNGCGIPHFLPHPS